VLTVQVVTLQIGWGSAAGGHKLMLQHMLHGNREQ
jgi:hypothetical protein